MLLLFNLLMMMKYVMGDLVPEYHEEPSNLTNENNIIVSSLWSIGVCACVGLICKHKKKLPIIIQPTNEYNYDDTIQYEINIKNSENIKKLKDDIDEFKKVVDQLYLDQKYEKKEKEKKEKKIEDYIEPQIRFQFGTGEIRYKENGKYYHGIGINETENEKWNKNNKFNKCIMEFKENKKLPHIAWDTYNAKEFCCNCSHNLELSKRRKILQVYQCNGHIMEYNGHIIE